MKDDTDHLAYIDAVRHRVNDKVYNTVIERVFGNITLVVFSSVRSRLYGRMQWNHMREFTSMLRDHYEKR